VWSAPATVGPYNANSSITALSPLPGGTRLAVGATGTFDMYQPTSATRLAFWDPAANTYAPPASGIGDFSNFGYAFTNSAATFNGDLYLGGQFRGIGTSRGRNLAKWDGATLSAAPGIPSTIGRVSAMLADQATNSLYIASDDFSQALARYDGATLTVLGDSDQTGYPSGISAVNQLVKYNGELVVAGSFSRTGKPSYIARRTGTTWGRFGGVDPNGAASALTTWSSPLIAGGANLLVISGSFTQVGALAAKVAAFDGTTWRALGQPSFTAGYSASPATELFVHDGDLHMAAYMNGINGNNNAYPIIIRYNPATDLWVELPRPAPPVVTGFGQPYGAVSYGGSIWVATGSYSIPGMFNNCGLLRWDGTRWSTYGGMGAGFSSQAYGVHAHNNEIILLGGFGVVGQQVSGQGGNAIGGVVSHAWARLDPAGAPPAINTQPRDAQVCAGGSVDFVVTASTLSPPLRYQWYVALPGDPLPTAIVNGSNGRFVATGATSGTLRVSGVVFGGDLEIYAEVVDECQQAAKSRTAILAVCGADYNCDGFVDFFDFDDFVLAFETGVPSADFNADGFIDFFDFDDYVAQFESGC
jgi:hypothetical protein